jgi:hypothetical protein
MRLNLQRYCILFSCFAFFVALTSLQVVSAQTAVHSSSKKIIKHTLHEATKKTELSSYDCISGDTLCFDEREYEISTDDIFIAVANNQDSTNGYHSQLSLFAKQVTPNYLLDEETFQKTTTSQ